MAKLRKKALKVLRKEVRRLLRKEGPEVIVGVVTGVLSNLFTELAGKRKKRKKVAAG
ncbi:hypothetical protein [Hymenobacter latericus]|uniref:hypothetical protein n=1 Tax=Hymenobacter sp. YIM 151858-1 TaxID=2987688 RepID=UPI002227DE62|nr:hypothetical protein [Hymenobacter sp. YIM 151858-1]UYZ58686.1 hypothetical protein OIS50_16685 [Hymenobacter sp. YIM 151858-1]